MKRIGLIFAITGLLTAFRSEYNFRIHFIATICCLTTACLLQVSLIEWILLVICIFLVFITEMFNTAIEQLVNMVQPDFHPLAAKVKDMAAGAVLLAAMVSLLIGVLIFGNRIFLLL